MPGPSRSATALHRGDEHLGAVRVVAEHVEAGAGGAEQHRIAALGAREGGFDGGFERRAALERRRRHRRRATRSIASASRPIVSTARAWRASGAASGAKSWPLPSPPRMTTSLPGARSAPRPSSAATVAPTLVPLLSSNASTPSMLATSSTRCGSPRYSRRRVQHRRERAADRGGERQRGQRVERVVPAADAQRVGRHQRCSVNSRGEASSSRARVSQAMSFSVARPQSPGRSRCMRAEADDPARHDARGAALPARHRFRRRHQPHRRGVVAIDRRRWRACRRPSPSPRRRPPSSRASRDDLQ